MPTKNAPSKPLKLAVHPSAELFPLMPEEELNELAESIKKHGLREKLVVDTDGVLIDGRNRYEAIKRAGLHIAAEDVTVMNFDNKPYTVDEYIVMANIERRNLTRQQRKELAGKLAVHLEEQQADKPKDEKVDTTAAAAKAAGVSRRTAASAKQETLVKLGLRDEPTKQNPPKKAPTKVEQGTARPPQVIKSLEAVAQAIHATAQKWPKERKKQAVTLAFGILASFAAEASVATIPEVVQGALGIPKRDAVKAGKVEG